MEHNVAQRLCAHIVIVSSLAYGDKQRRSTGPALGPRTRLATKMMFTRTAAARSNSVHVHGVSRDYHRHWESPTCIGNRFKPPPFTDGAPHLLGGPGSDGGTRARSTTAPAPKYI